MDSPEQRVPNQDESLSTVSPGQGKGTSRRGFLAGAAGAPLAASLISGGLFAGEASARESAAAPGFSVGFVSLNLEDKPAGFVKSASGGEVYADVKLEEGELFDKKAIGDPLYEDIELLASVGMEKRFFDWVAATWLGKMEPQDGSFVTFDHNQKPKSQRFFKQAYITETTFPALDGGSKDVAYLTLKLDPETTDYEPNPGSVQTPRPGEKKKWLCSNFKLEIDDLDCKGVSKIDSFTVKLTGPGGEPPPPGEKPSKLEFSNLKVTLTEATSSSWYKWFNKTVLVGNPDLERNGRLVALDPSGKELFSVDMEGLGLLRFAPVKLVAGSEAVLRNVAELYVESMQFNPPE